MAITLDDRIREDLGYLYNRQEMAGANSLQGTIKKRNTVVIPSPYHALLLLLSKR